MVVIITVATVPRTYQRKIAHGTAGSSAVMPQLPLEYAFSASLVCSRVPPTQGGSKTADHIEISESPSPENISSNNTSTCHVPSTVLGTEDTAVN